MQWRACPPADAAQLTGDGSKKALQKAVASAIHEAAFRSTDSAGVTIKVAVRKRGHHKLYSHPTAHLCRSWRRRSTARSHVPVAEDAGDRPVRDDQGDRAVPEDPIRRYLPRANSKNPSTFGIRTFGNVWALIVSLSLIMSLSRRR
jgi:hypothetical protein